MNNCKYVYPIEYKDRPLKRCLYPYNLPLELFHIFDFIRNHTNTF